MGILILSTHSQIRTPPPFDQLGMLPLDSPYGGCIVHVLWNSGRCTAYHAFVSHLDGNVPLPLNQETPWSGSQVEPSSNVAVGGSVNRASSSESNFRAVRNVVKKPWRAYASLCCTAPLSPSWCWANNADSEPCDASLAFLRIRSILRIVSTLSAISSASFQSRIWFRVNLPLRPSNPFWDQRPTWAVWLANLFTHLIMIGPSKKVLSNHLSLTSVFALSFNDLVQYVLG